MKANWEILVVDDEELMAESLAAWLREDGYAVDTAASGGEAIDKARSRPYAIYFIDLRMPGGLDGIETMIEIRRFQPEASVVIITAYATVDTAVAAMKEGAQEYIVKPCNPAEISLLVGRIIKLKNLQRENAILRKKLTRQYRFQDILSKNARMHDLMQLDEEGARTGAADRKKGKFELADGGTIFLDEIGDISPKLQVDLLRVLQERSFYRLGGAEEVQVDVRVIAATHVNLEQAVADGRFRDDLFYRLNVIEARIPPLRERREDIPLLANHFVERIAHELRKDLAELSDGALKVLLDHEWPGNVRELENAIERAVVTCHGRVLTEEDFAFLGHAVDGRKAWSVPTNLSLQEIEKQAIEATLRRHDGNIKETAATLGIERSTLYEKIKKYAIER